MDPQGDLRRELGRAHVLAVVIGSMLGTGIYLRPASIAQLTGSPRWFIGVWLVAGLLSLCGALIYAQLAARLPGTAGEYRFLRETLGRLPAFLSGWMRLTISPAVVAGLAVATTVFLGDIVDLGAPARRVIALLIILGLAWINTRGVKTAGGFQVIVTASKVGGLALLIGAVMFAQPTPTVQVAWSSPSTVNGVGLGGAILAAMAAYNGWVNVSLIGGEVREAQRLVPWALACGVVIVISLYVTTNLVYLNSLGMAAIAGANSTAHPTAPSVGGLAARHLLGESAANALPLLFALSALGTAHCNFLAQPRVFYTMAQDGWLPQALVCLSPGGTPSRAVWMFAGLAALFALAGSYDRLTNMTAFAFYVFFGLTAFGFLWSMRKPSVRSTTPRAALWIGVAMVFLSGTIVLLITSLLRGSIELLTASALISVGIPIYVLIEYFRRRRA